MMYHVSPACNYLSIFRSGLQLRFATGKRRIWIVTPGKVKWAIKHVLNRHECEAVVVVSVTISRKQITRYKRGIYFTEQDIPATHLRKE